MTTPDQLAVLARLQSLRERRERVRTEQARFVQTASERTYRQCLEEEEAMQDAVFAESRQANLCLDRWRMLAGQLTINERRSGAALAELAAAQEDFDRAKDQLALEITRTQELETRFRRATRKFAAKKDEAELQIVRSLNASIDGSALR